MDKKPEELLVFFVNDRTARLPKDKTRIARVTRFADEDITADVEDGKYIVNWDNVCYLREYEPPKEDDD